MSEQYIADLIYIKLTHHRSLDERLGRWEGQRYREEKSKIIINQFMDKRLAILFSIEKLPFISKLLEQLHHILQNGSLIW